MDITYDTITNFAKTGKLPSLFQEIEGWLSPEEANVLAGLASMVGNDHFIVEIGHFRGKSTFALGCGAASGHCPPVFSFDPHAHWKVREGVEYGAHDMTATYRNLAAMPSAVAERIHIMMSEHEICSPTWPELSVELLFIDALHDSQSVLKDFRAWRRTLTQGAAVVFHDTNEDPVASALIRLLEDYPNNLVLKAVGDGMTVAQWFLALPPTENVKEARKMALKKWSDAPSDRIRGIGVENPQLSTEDEKLDEYQIEVEEAKGYN